MTLTTGRIFFLGAGFSAGAGIPLTNALLPKAANLFAAEAPGLYHRVCNYADQVDVNLRGSPNAEQFAKLCTHIEFIELREYGGGERWSAHGSREKLALRFFLAKAIALATPDPAAIPNHYIDFARSLSPDDIVVTFNWDLLLEKAIQRAEGRFSYSWEEGKIQILKLHGSIDWVSDEPRAMRQGAMDLKYQPLGLSSEMTPKDIFRSPLLGDKANWMAARPLSDEVRPMLVLPGYGKAFDVRQLASLWYRIEILNVRHGGVSIIGLNVSDDDFIVESLFRYLFRGIFSDGINISMINPDTNVKTRFDQLAGRQNIKFICQRFSAETVAQSLTP